MGFRRPSYHINLLKCNGDSFVSSHRNSIRYFLDLSMFATTLNGTFMRWREGLTQLALDARAKTVFQTSPEHAKTDELPSQVTRENASKVLIAGPFREQCSFCPCVFGRYVLDSIFMLLNAFAPVEVNIATNFAVLII